MRHNLFMRMRAIPALAIALLAAAAALPGADKTLDDLVRTVREANSTQRGDSELARALRRLHLTERLDNRTAEELESEAPGPKSIAELEDLRDSTRNLPLRPGRPWFASPPAPTPGEFREVFVAAMRKALGYTASLPDFLCTETVHRYVFDTRWENWQTTDVLTLQLTYFERVENYRLIAVNGRKTALTYEQTGGALSKGEFGSMLLSVFSPDSKTVMRWSNWTTLRKRPTYVFAFQIDAANSRYHLEVGHYGGGSVSTTPGEHGLVYIDRETRETMRLDSEADSIPADFPVAGASRTLDYGPGEVGGRSYLLPLHAEVRMVPRGDRHVTRNKVDFSAYRKFSGESTIQFGDPPGEPGKQ